MSRRFLQVSVVILALASTVVAAITSTQRVALGGKGARARKSDRERRGFIGPVRKVRITGFDFEGEWIEWPNAAQMFSEILVYDGDGNLIERSNYWDGGKRGRNKPDAKTISKYDVQGNEIEHTFRVGLALISRWTASYDARGRSKERMEYGADASVVRKWSCTYDGTATRSECVEYGSGGEMGGRIVVSCDGHGKEIEKVEYDPRGQISHKFTFTYDVDGNKTHETRYHKDGDGSRLDERTYTYDDFGNRTEETRYYAARLVGRTTRRYDHRGNLTEEIEYNGEGSVDEQRSISYVLDSRGNWVSAVVNDTSRRVPWPGRSQRGSALLILREITYEPH